jgi:hypothetical protein
VVGTPGQVAEANEGLADVDARLFDPDPKGKYGTSARLIGYSPTAVAVLVVILVHREDKPGTWWGANGWRANSRGPTCISKRSIGMSNDAKQFVEQIAAEADATADQPMPAAATSTRPNKSVTVATRVSPEDLHAIEALATELDVPVSALVRGWVLAGLNARKAESLTTALDRITADVQRLRELVA